MTDTVAVIGGGIGGLSAAQELAERGFEVAVYERNERFGGKARSVPGPDPGPGPALPGEHGFRFFPGYYRHLPDTMSRIPYGDNPDGVADNLVETTHMLQADMETGPRVMPTETPTSLADWRKSLESVFGGKQVPPDESAYFASRLLYLLTSCDARWEREHEHTTWWEFIDAEEMSPAYRSLLGDGLTTLLVAMRPQVSSTRTIGRVYLQIFRGLFDRSIAADRLLNGPSNEVWIDPWTEYLASLGVELHAGTTATRLHCDGERITGVTIRTGAGSVGGPGRTDAAGGSADPAGLEADGGRERTIEADHYVLAVPVEVARQLVTPTIAAAAPSLSHLDRLRTSWMNGLQFYLTEDVAAVHGHEAYFDAPWALTAISQQQFWAECDLADHGDGAVEGVLSVIVSEWDEPGIVHGKPARECTREELIEEVWAQLTAHLNHDGEVLDDEMVYDVFVDPAIDFGADGTVENGEPLLINTAGSLPYRPEAATGIENLVLAADYVRTYSDLACMETANEAARRATNAVLDRSGVEAPRCGVWDFEWPDFVEPLRRQDRRRMRFGLPHPGETSPAFWRTYQSLVPSVLRP